MEHGTAKKDNYYLPEGLWQKGRNLIVVIGAVAWILSLIGAFIDKEQFFFSYTVAFWFLAVISLGGLFWAMVQYVSGAAASVTVRRIMENIAVGLPYAVLLFIPIALGLPYLYKWADPAVVAHDEVLSGRGLYFAPWFFLLRAFIYLAIWGFTAVRLYQHATRLDDSQSIMESIAQTRKAERTSSIGLVLLFLTGTLAAWEWIMSLDARAFSTIFGVYNLANGALACIGVITLIALLLRRNGVLENTITIEHYHDLGKWMFAITIFWAYAAFAQYMLIWYANIPEETQYFYHRYQGSWYFVGMILIFGHFVFPFVFLLNRLIKRRFGALVFAALFLLFVCYTDVYWEVMPMLHRQGVQIHWLDFTTFFAVASVFAFGFWQRMKKRAMVPVGDVRLVQSLAFKNQ